MGMTCESHLLLTWWAFKCVTNVNRILMSYVVHEFDMWFSHVKCVFFFLEGISILLAQNKTEHRKCFKRMLVIKSGMWTVSHVHYRSLRTPRCGAHYSHGQHTVSRQQFASLYSTHSIWLYFSICTVGLMRCKLSQTLEKKKYSLPSICTFLAIVNDGLWLQSSWENTSVRFQGETLNIHTKSTKYACDLRALTVTVGRKSIL